MTMAFATTKTFSMRPTKQPKIQSLDVGNNTFIITTSKVQQGDVYSFLKNKVRKKEFAKGSIFLIYAGAHGYSDGRLGDGKKGSDHLLKDIEGQISGFREDVEETMEDQLELLKLHRDCKEGGKNQ